MPKKQTSEEQLHQLWQKLRPGTILSLRDGRQALLVHPGVANKSDGPDFFMTGIRIEGILHVGNTEIHVNENDWFAHGHQDDPKYTEILLHVILNEGANTTTGKATFVFPPQWIEESLVDTTNFEWPSRSLTQKEWLALLEQKGILRLWDKADRVRAIASICSFDLQQVFFITVLKAYGLPFNEEAMEILALQLPYHRLARHPDSTFIEAILCGFAGFLSTYDKDRFPPKYHEEWTYYAEKFHVEPLPILIWKHSSVRPHSFPENRIIQAAAFFNWYFTSSETFQRWHNGEIPDPELFAVSPGNDWLTHRASFSGFRPAAYPGQDSRKVLFINGLIPFLLFYSEYAKRNENGAVIIEKLKKLPAENNSTIRQFCSQVNIEHKKMNMLQAQGVLSMMKNTRNFIQK